MESVRQRYPLKFWRPFFDIGLCYAVIALSIVASMNSAWVLPLALIVIANRLLALSLLCHEGLHHSLFENKWLNHFVGRWLCAFPTCISFSKYKKLHLMHHSSVGHQRFDPDLHLYNQYPLRLKSFLWLQLKDLLTLKTTYKFIVYYTEIFDYLKPRPDWFRQAKMRQAGGDFISFFIYFITTCAVVTYFNIWPYYILFFIVPLLVLTQPYVLLMGGLQHGPLPTSENKKDLSRTVLGPKLFIEMVLPLNINYHAEHHYNSAVPHYWLAQYSKDIKNDGIKLWQESYSQSLYHLFVGR